MNFFKEHMQFAWGLVLLSGLVYGASYLQGQERLEQAQPSAAPAAETETSQVAPAPAPPTSVTNDVQVTAPTIPTSTQPAVPAQPRIRGYDGERDDD
ncbi:MAG TPA: hypothetical protein VMH91_00760 [Candidatus Paceibacterota bacterium]|nr:hypothetical protein [Candidatus Paceibacterota bacterium]